MPTRAFIPLVACGACLASLGFILVEDAATRGGFGPAEIALDAGSWAPDFRLQALRGTTIESADLRGEIVVLDVWATWCAPCLTEIPRYERLRQQYAGRGVTIIGVAVDSGTPAQITESLARLGSIAYPIALGTADFEQRYGPLWALPTTFLIDRDWNVRKVWTGARAGKHQQLVRTIEQLLDNDPGRD